jgi:hypothetical protein
MRSRFNGLQLRIRNSILLILHANVFTAANIILSSHRNDAVDYYGAIDADKLPDHSDLRFDWIGNIAISDFMYRGNRSRCSPCNGGYETCIALA